MEDVISYNNPVRFIDAFSGQLDLVKLGFLHYYVGCYFLTVNNNCLTAAKCENKTTGTIQHGNQINGKYKSAILGWSNAIF